MERSSRSRASVRAKTANSPTLVKAYFRSQFRRWLKEITLLGRLRIEQNQRLTAAAFLGVGFLPLVGEKVFQPCQQE